MRGHSQRVFVAIVVAIFLAAPAGARKLMLAQTQQSTAVPTEADMPSVTVLGSRQAQSVLGKEVRSSANENMGRIVDVIVERSGRVRAAVIDFGGFLGVGSRKIAVDWNALHFAPESKSRDVITLELTRDQVKEAPEYKDKQPVIVLGASGALQSMPNE
jgi:PRC-barrel domain protein